MVVIGYTGLDPNPYVGDVPIRAFTSFTNNQIKWNKAMSFDERDENMEGLKLIGEPDPIGFLKKITKVMKSTTIFVAIGEK